MACAVAQPEFVVDSNFSDLPGYVTTDGLTTLRPITNRFDEVVKSEGARPSISDVAIGRIMWDGTVYYVLGKQYTSAEQYQEYRRSVASGKSDSKALPNGGVCELFLYDASLNLLARHKLQLPDENGGPWCNGSKALGRARAGMPALLYSVSYYLVGHGRAKRAKDIGKGWRYSTYLIRLERDSNGAVRFVQDDRCLGNPNSYATIAEARKALKGCPNTHHDRPQH